MARTRLAPSPTGALHLGNARTFALTWLWARAHGHGLPLRMEDIDSPRKKSWAAEQALDDLRWIGIDWDGEPLVQSSRAAAHVSALEGLIDAEYGIINASVMICSNDDDALDYSKRILWKGK